MHIVLTLKEDVIIKFKGQAKTEYISMGTNTGCSIKKGIDKKLLVGPAHGFSSQFLNLFAFSICVSFGEIYVNS